MKKYRRVMLLLLLLVWAAVYLWRGMEYMYAFVVVVGSIGAVSACIATWGVWRQRSHLIHLSKEPLNLDGNLEDIKVRNRVRWQTLAGFKLPPGKEKAPWKFRHAEESRFHLEERIAAILEARGTGATSDRALPRLSDLTEITAMAERSRPSVCIMSVIISFLLILGILGTLFGIHECLGGVEDLHKLKVLKPALLPSALAVGFTVFLIMLRGVYRQVRLAYMLRLNAYTVGKLFPKFHTDTTEGTIMRDIAAGLAELNTSFGFIKDVAENAAAAGSDYLHTPLQVFAAQLYSLASLCSGMKLRTARAADQFNIQSRLLKKTGDAAVALKTRFSKLMEVSGTASGVAADYGRMAAALLSALKSLAASLQERIKWVEEDNRKLSECLVAAGNIRKSADAVDAAGQTVAQFREKAQQLSLLAGEAAREWSLIRQNTGKSTAAEKEAADKLASACTGFRAYCSRFFDSPLAAPCAFRDVLSQTCRTILSHAHTTRELRRQVRDCPQVTHPLSSTSEIIIGGGLVACLAFRLFFF